MLCKLVLRYPTLRPVDRRIRSNGDCVLLEQVSEVKGPEARKVNIMIITFILIHSVSSPVPKTIKLTQRNI